MSFSNELKNENCDSDIAVRNQIFGENCLAVQYPLRLVNTELLQFCKNKVSFYLCPS